MATKSNVFVIFTLLLMIFLHGNATFQSFGHASIQSDSHLVNRLEKWTIGILEIQSCKWLVNVATKNHCCQFSVTNKTFSPYEIRTPSPVLVLKTEADTK